MTGADYIAAAAAAALAIWESRHNVGSVGQRIASLGSNLGPRVQSLSDRISRIEGRLNMPPPPDEDHGSPR